MSLYVIMGVNRCFDYSDAKSCPVTYDFFLAGGLVGESVENRVFSNPNNRVDLEKMFTPVAGSHGHYGGGKNRFCFPYAGRNSPFPSKIQIARMMKKKLKCLNNIRSHSYGLIRPFRAPGRCIWVASWPHGLLTR